MNEGRAVRVRLHGHLRALSGRPEVRLEAQAGESVGQLLERCQRQVAGLQGALVDGQGRLLGAVVVAVDSEILPFDRFETRTLHGGESIDIIPELTGG